MNTFDQVNALLRAEHTVSVFDEPGGAAWSCSCGRRSVVGAYYPSEAQARARSARHLQAARRAIERGATPRPIPPARGGESYAYVIGYLRAELIREGVIDVKAWNAAVAAAEDEYPASQ